MVKKKQLNNNSTSKYIQGLKKFLKLKYGLEKNNYKELAEKWFNELNEEMDLSPEYKDDLLKLLSK